MATHSGPLTGIKVVTCSTAQAGTVPYMLMADLGANVIKIEIPGTGDSSRKVGEIRSGLSSFFETNNRGVKSLTLNLKTKKGKAILYKLIKTADIFGQNFRPGVAENNGFSYEHLRKINPRLVYASISGYGSLGPHSSLPGTDAIGQALGGVTEAYTGPNEIMRTGVVSVADESCAMLTFGGLLAALHHAKSTGLGQKVETSLVGGVVRLMGWTLTTTMWKDQGPITGARFNGTRERPGLAATFNDKYGKPLVFQIDHSNWEKAMRAIGFWDELETRGISDLGLALISEEKKSVILETLTELFSLGDRDQLIKLLRNADIVSAPVNTLLEASKDADILANGYVQELEYPEIGKTLKVHGTPWQFSETPVQIGRAPKLGEHNEEILSSIGYNEQEIKSLIKLKVI